MPHERPELPGQAVWLENAERFVAATGAVVVIGGGSLGLLRVTVLNISASLLNIKMVFQAKVAWFGPSHLSTFLCYKRLFLK
ncbi:MAG: hypothetical protein LW834_20190 [Cyanobium sp. 49614_E6]|nr:hypothetical protein [Cyanobium sp. 49614_E6]